VEVAESGLVASDNRLEIVKTVLVGGEMALIGAEEDLEASQG